MSDVARSKQFYSEVLRGLGWAGVRHAGYPKARLAAGLRCPWTPVLFTAG